jgi:hypothetical protein
MGEIGISEKDPVLVTDDGTKPGAQGVVRSIYVKKSGRTTGWVKMALVEVQDLDGKKVGTTVERIRHLERLT